MKNYLAHHGVAGQKWGQRHGPPYPLSRDPANAKRAQADHKKNKASTKTSSNPPRVSRGSTPSSMQVHVMKGIISDRKYRKELAKQQKREQEEYEEAQRAEKAAAVKRRKYLEKEAKKGRLTRAEQEEYTDLVWSDKRQAEAEAAKQQAQQEKYKNTMSLISSAAVMTQKVAMAAERIGYARNALAMLSERQKDRNQKLKIKQMELNTDLAKTKIKEEAGIKKNEQKYDYQKSKDSADRRLDKYKFNENLKNGISNKDTGYSTKNKDKTFNKDKNKNKGKYNTPKPQNNDTTYKKRWKDIDIFAKNKDGTYQRNDVITNYRRSQFTQKTMETKLSSAYADYTKSKYVSYADLQPSVKSIKVSDSSLNRIKEAQRRRTRMEEISRQKAMTESLQRSFLNSKGNKNAYYSMRHSMFLSPEEQMLLYLAHHGVSGQKWGQRHGPPYPLSRNPANAKRARVDYKSNLGKGVAITAGTLLGLAGMAGVALATGYVIPPVGAVIATGMGSLISQEYKTHKSRRLTEERDEIAKKHELKESPEQKETRKKKQKAIFDAQEELYANFNPLESTNTAKLEYSSTTNKHLQKALEIKKDTKISEVLGSKNQELASKTPEKISHGVNPNYSKVAAGYHDNCLKCSLTMEMRMRGYDVQAKASRASEIESMSQQSTPGLMAHFTKTPDTYAYSKFTRSKNIIKEKDFINSLPDGRYMINGPTNTGGGHSIYGIKKDGKIKYYDTQSNNGTAYSFFNAASGKSIGKELINNSTDSFAVEFIRLDNLSESDFYNISDYCEKSK